MFVKFRTILCGQLLEDAFLWPSQNRSVLEMKIFAVNLLADTLSRSQFIKIDPRDIERKFLL